MVQKDFLMQLCLSSMYHVITNTAFRHQRLDWMLLILSSYFISNFSTTRLGCAVENTSPCFYRGKKIFVSFSGENIQGEKHPLARSRFTRLPNDLTFLKRISAENCTALKWKETPIIEAKRTSSKKAPYKLVNGAFPKDVLLSFLIFFSRRLFFILDLVIAF